MKIKERIEEINALILKLKEERTNIQDRMCEHSNTIGVHWEDRPGRVYPARICEDCGVFLDTLTDKDYYIVKDVIKVKVPDPKFYYTEQSRVEALERYNNGEEVKMIYK